MQLSTDLALPLSRVPHRWLVTGAAGFIGSHLVETLGRAGQWVRGVDNLSTGRRNNLDHVRHAIGEEAWGRFEFHEGDIRDASLCERLCEQVDYVLHQAAMASVPASLADPGAAHAHNVTGTLHLLAASRRAGVKRFVYASSCAVYGDAAKVPVTEDQPFTPLSPYAATKCAAELYAGVYTRCESLPTIGLRYFNIYGPRQDPGGAYAAVIPKWIHALIHREPVHIFGDGETSRDFVYVGDVVEANLRSVFSARPEAFGRAFNVGTGQSVTLNELFHQVRNQLAAPFPHAGSTQPHYDAFRPGDIRHSRADLKQARNCLGFEPRCTLEQGLAEALPWYCASAVQTLPG